MKKQLVCLLISLLAISSAFAQFGMKKKVKQAKQVKERILLVPVEDSEFGERFKTVIQNNWTYNEEIKYVTPKEFKTISKNKKERKAYAVLDFLEDSRRFKYLKNAVTVRFLEEKKPVHHIIIHSVYKDSKSDSKKVKDNVNEADLLFAVHQLQSQLIKLTKYKKTKRKEVMKNLQKYNDSILKDLKTKTLLVEETMFSKKALKEFKETYKYPYEIVHKEVIDDAIINSYDDTVYVKGILQTSSLSKVSGVIVMVNYSIYDSVTNEQVYAFFSGRDINLTVKDIKNLVKSMK